MALGLSTLVLGVRSALVEPPAPTPWWVAQCLIGALQVVLGWLVLRRSRAGWAFALSLNGTAFVAALFGAPVIRDRAGVHLAVALIPCVLHGAVSIMLALEHDAFVGKRDAD
jgi:hypothetical protein